MRCSEREWSTHVPDEDRYVADLCSHIALGYVAETQALKAAAIPTRCVEWRMEAMDFKRVTRGPSRQGKSVMLISPRAEREHHPHDHVGIPGD